MNKRTDSSKNDILLKYLIVLARCYSTGSFYDLFPLLAEDVVWESQCVLEPRCGKPVVMTYYIDKGKRFRTNHCCPDCYIIRFVGSLNTVRGAHATINVVEEFHGSVGILYPEGKYAMFMHQIVNGETVTGIVDLQLDENDLISRIDLCLPEFYRFEIVDPSTYQNID